MLTVGTDLILRLNNDKFLFQSLIIIEDYRNALNANFKTNWSLTLRAVLSTICK